MTLKTARDSTSTMPGVNWDNRRHRLRQVGTERPCLIRISHSTPLRRRLARRPVSAACARPPRPSRSLFFIVVGVELSSVALGGKIVNVSDEFFAAAFHLLLVEVSPFPMSIYPWLRSPIALRSTESRSAAIDRPHVARTESERSVRTKRRLVQWMGVEEAQCDIRLVRWRFDLGVCSNQR